jgi:hypothetical protein
VGYPFSILFTLVNQPFKSIVFESNKYQLNLFYLGANYENRLKITPNLESMKLNTNVIKACDPFESLVRKFYNPNIFRYRDFEK